jgi:23S rRNA (guanosine2251-2'-O)-methyltransferase
MSNTIFIYGKNAVLGAAQNRPDTIERIFIEKGKNFEKDFEDRLFGFINTNKIPKENFLDKDLGKDVKDVNHQGILAKVRVDDLTVSFEYFLENLQIDKNTCLLILGELEDVQNVGSIIRSALAFGVAGILLPEHNQAQINATIVKISAGAAFSIPLVKIGNVNTAIEKLKEHKFWVYGLDGTATKTIYEEEYSEPTVFVVGNEGDGIREKTRDHCDLLLSIPISDKCESLNAAISTAVTLYEWRRQKLTHN